MVKFLIFAVQPFFLILLSDSIHSRVFNGFVINFQDEREFLAHCLPEIWGAYSPGCASIFFFLILFIYLFIYLWLCWVFVSVRGPSPVVASGGHSSSRCAGLSLSRPLLLRSTGSRRASSVIVAHGPSRSAACGILPDQGSNPYPLHWQADSQPLRHQGSPYFFNYRRPFILKVYL